MKHTSTTFPDLPRGERMRSFYRAVKRREKWALKIDAMVGIPRLLALMYRRIDFKEIIFRPNPLLALINKDTSFEGKYFPVPNNYKDEK